jgi:hypothetical protein
MGVSSAMDAPSSMDASAMDDTTPAVSATPAVSTTPAVSATFRIVCTGVLNNKVEENKWQMMGDYTYRKRMGDYTYRKCMEFAKEGETLCLRHLQHRAIGLSTDGGFDEANCKFPGCRLVVGNSGKNGFCTFHFSQNRF